MFMVIVVFVLSAALSILALPVWDKLPFDFLIQIKTIIVPLSQMEQNLSIFLSNWLEPSSGDIVIFTSFLLTLLVCLSIKLLQLIFRLLFGRKTTKKQGEKKAEKLKKKEPLKQMTSEPVAITPSFHADEPEEQKENLEVKQEEEPEKQGEDLEEEQEKPEEETQLEPYFTAEQMATGETDTDMEEHLTRTRDSLFAENDYPQLKWSEEDKPQFKEGIEIKGGEPEMTPETEEWASEPEQWGSSWKSTEEESSGLTEEAKRMAVERLKKIQQEMFADHTDLPYLRVQNFKPDGSFTDEILSPDKNGVFSCSIGLYDGKTQEVKIRRNETEQKYCVYFEDSQNESAYKPLTHNKPIPVTFVSIENQEGNLLPSCVMTWFGGEKPL